MRRTIWKAFESDQCQRAASRIMPGAALLGDRARVRDTHPKRERGELDNSVKCCARPRSRFELVCRHCRGNAHSHLVRPAPCAPCLQVTRKRRGFTLLEIILVLAVIGIAAAILVPTVSSAFTIYHLERASEDLQSHLLHTRLQALELGIPYAFTYRPGSDQFMVWACEPLELDTALATSGSTSVATISARQSGDSYDRHVYELNDRTDNREFRFMSASLDEALLGMGLSHEARAAVVVGTSAQSAASSSLLSQQKLGLITPSLRSVAALQVPGLQLGEVAEPIVFEPDGTADRDAIIRLADRSNRYVEITVHALTGAITASDVLSAEQLGATRAVHVSVDQPRGFMGPSRSREVSAGTRGE